jgi:hypothetical protein
LLTRLEVQIERLAACWCRVLHHSVRWPVHGEYECATCYRRFPVPWAERPERHPSLRIQRATRDHHSVTVWAPPHHDSTGRLPVF